MLKLRREYRLRFITVRFAMVRTYLVKQLKKTTLQNRLSKFKLFCQCFFNGLYLRICLILWLPLEPTSLALLLFTYVCHFEKKESFKFCEIQFCFFSSVKPMDWTYSITLFTLLVKCEVDMQFLFSTPLPNIERWEKYRKFCPTTELLFFQFKKKKTDCSYQGETPTNL